MTAENLLNLPKNAGRAIVEAGAVIARRLLGADQFVQYCSERSLSITRERLLCLERLGLFAPVFRVTSPEEAVEPFYIPIRDNNNWFDNGWAWDTTTLQPTYRVPNEADRTQEGYYSIFQLDHLHMVLQDLTMQVPLDSYLESQSIDWPAKGEMIMQYANAVLEGWRMHEYRRCIPLLCQFISNRYYAETQGDLRTIRTSGGHYGDQWIEIDGLRWDWYEYARAWNPHEAESLFELTPQKLRYAFETLAVAQASCDPLERWYQLIQFVSLDQRARLKSDALRAETLRAGAHMLRLLYKDLYNEELKHPNEVHGTIITHIPELEIRQDVRRHLEFVANRYGLNPQPKLSLIVEGQSEETAVLKIFENYFGAHPGVYGIEIIVLGSVDVATGSKDDRFRAILRLIDYLHHHQTFTFLILDNENYAGKLKREARRAKSIHSKQRYVTRPEYIRIWNLTFEFDNFSCSEIAMAMNNQARGCARFTPSEIAGCKAHRNPGACLKNLYKHKTNYGLKKIELSEMLVEHMVSPASRRKIENRPIIKALARVAKIAAQNPLPTMLETWEINQASKFLGKKRKP